MQALDRHISLLLHHHDCVVIPGFGAFLLRYYPAEFQKGTGMFRPPSRRICFQQKLVENDGILGHYIARRERISYRAALSRIDEFSTQWRKKLEERGRLHLAGIGKLSVQADGLLEFFPELSANYLPDSFGLNLIRTPELRIKARPVLPTTAISEKPEVAKFVARNEEPLLYKGVLWRAAAIVLPIALALNVVSTSRNTAPVLLQEARSTAGWMYHDTAEDETNFPQLEELELEEADAEIKTEAVADIVEVETVETPIVKEVKETRIQEKYFLIVGAFSEDANAHKFVESLRSEGYNARIHKGNGRLARVSVSGHPDRSSADAALVGIKKNLCPTAWVYQGE